MIGRTLVAGWALVLVTGCAVRLGGPGPVEYRVVALSAGSGAAPEDVAGWIRQADANVVLLSAAAADSTWFGEVAQRSSLSLSGPGSAGQVAFAFLASEPVGDTTIVLSSAEGASVVVHDALYKVDKHRYLDLLALRIGSAPEARVAVKALLRYVATDVMPEAAVVLAVEVPDAATGDSVAAFLDPAFRDARACLAGRGAERRSAGMRLFYGPEARLRCEDARLLGGDDSPILARLVVGR